MVSGVAQVSVFGAQKYAVRVDSRSAASWPARGIGIDEVAHGDPKRQRRTCRPARSTARTQTFVVQANGQLINAAGVRPMIVAYRNGNPVRLDEVAHVYDGVENDKTASWFNGTARDLPRRSRNSRAPTSSRSSTRSSAAADVPRAVAAAVIRSTSAPIARSRSANRSTTSSSRCC